MYCEKCGKEMYREARYCGICGGEQEYERFGPEDLRYEEEIEARVCNACGGKLLIKSAFCPHCGKPVEKAPKRPLCLTCDEPLVAGARFCIACGAKYAEAEDGFLLVEEMPVCGSCGAELEEGMTFCPSCGAPPEKRVNQPPAHLLPVCGKCGALRTKSGRYCFSCGAPIGTKVPQIVGDTVICRKCGEKMEKGGMRKKCWGCGAELAIAPWHCKACGKENMQPTEHCFHCGANRL